MLFLFSVVSCSVFVTLGLSTSTDAFPPSWNIFSSNFKQPEPPTILAEYKAQVNQHKWNENVSHIFSGFMYNSPSNHKVRVDETFDSSLGSSLFDYSNVTQSGVANRQWILSPAVASKPLCFNGFVNPAFPLIARDLLITSGGVFGGVVDDPYAGNVATWNILFQGTIPARVLLNENNIIQGYDFWSPDLRTYVVTRFFNIVVGQISEDVFNFPCS